MHATDLDIDYDCPACSGTGDALDADSRDACPICGGSGTHNRYADPPDGEVWIGRLNYYRAGPVIKVERNGQMPVEDDVTGGFNGRYGTYEAEDPNQDYKPDMLNQLANRPLGTNGPYEVYGTTIEEGDFPGGTWPASADLTINQIIAWVRARDDEPTAQLFEHLQTQLGL